VINRSGWFVASLSPTERDWLTVDRDDHVVGFDAGPIGRAIGADGAHVWVGARDTDVHVVDGEQADNENDDGRNAAQRQVHQALRS
jgi:hypothetical protein